MDDAALKARIAEAEGDEVGRECREHACRTLASTFAAVGNLLWVGGYIIGPDRVSGDSPFRFGSDACVGLGTVTQVAGELTAGAVILLERDNLYAAAALVRQMVEAEYLAWAFAEDHAEAAAWLRASREDRLKTWRPAELRKRSGGRFRAADYAWHCERGGHPTPDAMALLPDHSRRDSVTYWWLDLAAHSVSAWEYISAAADDFGWGAQVREVAGGNALPETIERWWRDDSLAEASRALVSGR
jgi:hypothetical protein